MQENFLIYKHFKIHYSIIGNGDKPMLAFPGFNRASEDYKVLEPSLGKNFIIYSFDLFHHGKTEILPGSGTFLSSDLEGMIVKFTLENKIEKFSLLGYSLGGKLCLSVITLLPKKINDVYLLAPYGVKSMYIKSFLEKFRFVHNIFHSLIAKPEPFFRIIKIAFALKLIPKNLFEFLIHQMENRRRREMLYSTWKTYLKINPRLKKVQSEINLNSIPVYLFYGSMDPIEPPENGRLFAKGLHRKNALAIVPLNHQLVCGQMNTYLASIQ